jgi:hypothetical protein
MRGGQTPANTRPTSSPNAGSATHRRSRTASFRPWQRRCFLGRLEAMSRRGRRRRSRFGRLRSHRMPGGWARTRGLCEIPRSPRLSRRSAYRAPMTTSRIVCATKTSTKPAPSRMGNQRCDARSLRRHRACRVQLADRVRVGAISRPSSSLSQFAHSATGRRWVESTVIAECGIDMSVFPAVGALRLLGRDLPSWRRPSLARWTPAVVGAHCFRLGWPAARRVERGPSRLR